VPYLRPYTRADATAYGEDYDAVCADALARSKTPVTEQGQPIARCPECGYGYPSRLAADLCCTESD